MKKQKRKLALASAALLCLVLLLAGCSSVRKLADLSGKGEMGGGKDEGTEIETDLTDSSVEDPHVQGTDAETEGSAIEKDLEKIASVVRPKLLGNDEADEANVTASAAPYSVASGLANVTNTDQYYIQPGSEAERLLTENMFYVAEGWSKEFFETYENNRYGLTPNFVTVDSMMHTYHLYFSYLMKKTERNYLADQLRDVSAAMLSESQAQYEALAGTEWEAAAKRNVAFFAIGAKLQDLGVSVPDETADLVNSEISKIMEAAAISDCALTGSMIDYSQFKPRGYYEGDESLEKYFRAMMWYGQIGFLQKEEDLDRSALLMTLAMSGDILPRWESIYVVTSFFAGASDDLGYYEYRAAIDAAYGEDILVSGLAGNTAAWEMFRQLTAAMAPPAINSIPTLDDNDPSTKSTEENKGFRFMGQRFTVDAAIFQRLIYENVAENSAGERRMLPDTLDVPAALGSDRALEILQSEGATDYAGYSENMDALRASLTSADSSLWTASLYAGWLHTLSPLLEAKGEGYPDFMRTEAWTTKNLESFAGSFTELKHDTILYAKQVMAEMGGGPLPEWDDRGYVEPEAKVWSRFAALSKGTAEGLRSYGMLDSDDEENLLRLETMAEQFLTMTEKELSNTLLSDEEFDLIRNYGGNLEHFWTEVYKDEEEYVTTGDFPAAIVADIATDPNGTCLEVATGNPSLIYVIVPIDGELHICCGAVYTFYQFEQPLGDRLTDIEWRQRMGIAAMDDGSYIYDADIPQPEWTQSYRCDFDD